MAELGSNYLQANYIAPSSFTQSGGIIQTVVLNDTTQRTQSFTINSRAAITGLSASITPKRSNNLIIIYARWCGEVSTLWNSVFGMNRSGVDIGNPAGALSLQEAGITCGMDTYSDNNANNASTPAQMNFWFVDAPNSTGIVTYNLTFISSAGTVTLCTNRTITNSNTTSYELPSSAIYLMEVSK